MSPPRHRDPSNSAPGFVMNNHACRAWRQNNFRSFMARTAVPCHVEVGKSIGTWYWKNRLVATTSEVGVLATSESNPSW